MDTSGTSEIRRLECRAEGHGMVFPEVSPAAEEIVRRLRFALSRALAINDRTAGVGGQIFCNR